MAKSNLAHLFQKSIDTLTLFDIGKKAYIAPMLKNTKKKLQTNGVVSIVIKIIEWILNKGVIKRLDKNGVLHHLYGGLHDSWVVARNPLLL